MYFSGFICYRLCFDLFIFVLSLFACSAFGLPSNILSVSFCSKLEDLRGVVVPNVKTSFFFKENISYQVWPCREAISMILGTRFSLILGTRCSILRTRIESLRHLEKTLVKTDVVSLELKFKECWKEMSIVGDDMESSWGFCHRDPHQMKTGHENRWTHASTF